jgi:hypothetical protein
MQETVTVTETTTQTFNKIGPIAYKELVDAGYSPVTHGMHLEVTAPWTWHRQGNGWQFYLARPDLPPLHFYEDEEGVLYHD